MQQIRTHKEVTQRVEAKKLLSRRRQSEYSWQTWQVQVLFQEKNRVNWFKKKKKVLLQVRHLQADLHRNERAKSWQVQKSQFVGVQPLLHQLDLWNEVLMINTV